MKNKANEIDVVIRVLSSQTSIRGYVRFSFQNFDAIVLNEAPSALICHENGAFRKRPSNRRYSKTRAFRFHVDGIHFEKEL